MMKKNPKILSAILAASLFITALPPTVAKAASTYTPELMDSFVQFQVQGNDITDDEAISFDLYDSTNNKITSWTYGKEAEAPVIDGVTNLNNKEHFGITYKLDLPSVTNDADHYIKAIKFRERIYDKDGSEIGSTYNYYPNNQLERTYPNGSNVVVDMTYKAKSTQIDYTVPANTIRLINDERCENHAGVEVNDIEIANTGTPSHPLDVPFAAGEYSYMSGMTTGSYGGNAYNLLTVRDKPTTYRKVKIHLAKEYGSRFTDDGLFTLPKYTAEAVGLPTSSIGYHKFTNGDRYGSYEVQLCIASGSFIQHPYIDKNGDVEFYLCNESDYAYVYTDFCYSSNKGSGGGGGSNLSYCAQNEKQISVDINTQSIDLTKGLALQNIPDGKYKLVQTSTSKDRPAIKDYTFSLKHSDKVQIINIKLNNKGSEVDSVDPVDPVDPVDSVDPVDPIVPEDPTIEEIIKDDDIDSKEDQLSPFSVLQLKLKAKKTKSGKYINTISWKKLNDVDGYIIYGAKCGHKLKKITTVSANKTKWSQKKCKKGVYYKYLVAAYKGNEIVATSKTVHGIFASKKYTNPTGIKGIKKSLTLKAGKTFKIKGTVLVKSKKKRVQQHVALLRYESSNTAVAKVTKKGKIKALKKGKATIYVYTQNGICKKIKVTVK